MNRDALLRAVEILAAEPDPDKQVLRLQSAGFSGSDSRVLADVLPEAFAIPVAEELGVTSVSDMASARTRYGRWTQVRLSTNAIFVAALSCTGASLIGYIGLPRLSDHCRTVGTAGCGEQSHERRRRREGRQYDNRADGRQGGGSRVQIVVLALLAAGCQLTMG